VAHFLFHPAHVLKPGVADTIRELVEYGRTQGMEWWTNEQIYQWEMLRRSVKATFGTNGTFTLHAPKPLRGATLLLLKPRRRGTIRVNSQTVPGERRTLYGFDFDVVTADLSGEVQVQIG
jgi:hypothetical protein